MIIVVGMVFDGESLDKQFELITHANLSGFLWHLIWPLILIGFILAHLGG